MLCSCFNLLSVIYSVVWSNASLGRAVPTSDYMSQHDTPDLCTNWNWTTLVQSRAQRVRVPDSRPLPDFFSTRPKPAYSRRGLDWIIGPGYSFGVFSAPSVLSSVDDPDWLGGGGQGAIKQKRHSFLSFTGGPNWPLRCWWWCNYVRCMMKIPGLNPPDFDILRKKNLPVGPWFRDIKFAKTCHGKSIGADSGNAWISKSPYHPSLIELNLPV